MYDIEKGSNMEEIYKILRTLRFGMNAYKAFDIMRKLTGAAAGAVCAIFAIKLLKSHKCKGLKRLV